MKLSVFIIIIGFSVIIFGALFYFQSKSVIGPTQSFMYNNDEWSINGLIIISSGFFLLLLGILLKFKNILPGYKKDKNY
jgi:hypothetical protein